MALPVMPKVRYKDKIGKMLQKFSDSILKGSFGSILGIRIAQLFPNQMGYFVARQIASVMARRTRSTLVNAVRLNQWVVHGRKLSGSELDQHVRRVFHFQSRALFETFRYMDRPDRLGSLVSLSDKCREVLDDQMHSKRGLVLLLPHLCGFDLGGFSLATHGYKFLILSYPNPPSGYHYQNEIRRKHGMEVAPLSFDVLKQAMERLKEGGTILTGLDRPNPESGYSPKFFGLPASLPVSHIRLALKTNSVVRVIAMVAGMDHNYQIDVSDEIPMIPFADPHEEVIQNAERTLIETEKFINLDPDRWVMFFPVWPQVASEIPIL
jgi:KDO2-lipid IV(A) lauroyltransferase